MTSFSYMILFFKTSVKDLRVYLGKALVTTTFFKKSFSDDISPTKSVRDKR